MKKLINIIYNNKELILFYIFIVIILLLQVKAVERKNAEISRQKQQNYYIKELERK